MVGTLRIGLGEVGSLAHLLRKPDARHGCYGRVLPGQISLDIRKPLRAVPMRGGMSAG
jgi:hypothetical protein